MSVISKKLGQFKQWTGETFGSTDKTEASEDFKQLEMATNTRKEGIENMHSSLAGYATTLDGKDDKKLPSLDFDKKTPCLTGLGKAMVQQGRLQGEDNNYGLALLKIGEAENDLSTVQLELASKLRQGFLFDVGELLASVKEFEQLKKKLENRRLDYDAKRNKLGKSKKEKPALEEEVRACQFKYEETYNELLSLMGRFGEKEESLLGSLVEFSHIQAEFFSKGNEIMQKLMVTLKDAGLEAKQRKYALMKNSSFNSSQSSSIGKIAGPAEVKMLTAPTAISNSTVEDKREPRQSSSTTKEKPTKVLYRVRGLYQFKAEAEGDLGFNKGDLIDVISQVDDNWLSGEIREDDGTIRSGIFPANYVEKMTQGGESKSASKPDTGITISEETMNQMKSAIPTMVSNSVSDITAAITSVKLKSSKQPNKETSSSSSQAKAAAVVACGTCGCDDFHPNAFKQGHCNMCFHKH